MLNFGTKGRGLFLGCVKFVASAHSWGEEQYSYTHDSPKFLRNLLNFQLENSGQVPRGLDSGGSRRLGSCVIASAWKQETFRGSPSKLITVTGPVGFYICCCLVILRQHEHMEINVIPLWGGWGEEFFPRKLAFQMDFFERSGHISTTVQRDTHNG